MCSLLGPKVFYPSTLFVDAIGNKNEIVFVLEIIKFSDKKVLCMNMSFFIKIIKLRPLDAVAIGYLRPLQFDCVFYIEGRRHGEL